MTPTNDQLSGRINSDQKTAFNSVEGGTFAEKLDTLLKNYELNKNDTKFSISNNKDAIINALNVIVSNIDNIELNVNNFLDSKDTETKYNQLKTVFKEREALYEENKKLKFKIKGLEKQVFDIGELRDENIILLRKYNKLLEK